MAHFFIDETLTALTAGDVVTLSGVEGRHAATVSRLRSGELVSLGNGRGLIATVLVSDVEKNAVVFEVSSVREESEPRHAFVLAQALAKTDRDERAVESSVELGVDAIIPFAASRSVSRWDAAKEAKGRARWQSIAREASKQSLRAWVPEVRPMATISDLIALPGTRLIALDASGISPQDVNWTSTPGETTQQTVFVVGPEGGFSAEERNALIGAHATIVRLGSNVLRTSTAGPVALGIASTLSGRWP